MLDQISKMLPRLESKMDGVQVAVEAISGSLSDMAAAHRRVELNTTMQLDLLHNQTRQLQKINASTSATFTVVKSLAERKTEVPTFVLLVRKDTPEWNGEWYDNVCRNAWTKAQNAVGAKCFFELQFLCEKTLRPVPGAKPYELELPTAELVSFLKTAGPWLGATCAVLKLAATVARPLAKIVGFDLDDAIGIDLSEIREIQCGESTVGEVFEGTAMGDW